MSKSAITESPLPSVEERAAAPEKPLKILPKLGRILPCDREDDAILERAAVDNGPKLTSTFAEAVALFEKWRRDEKECEKQDLAAIGRRYVEVLLRVEFGPQPGDAEELADLCYQLALTPASMQADLEAIRAAIKLRALHDREPQLRSEACKAGIAFLDLKKQQEKEIRDAERAKGITRMEHEKAMLAPLKLRQIMRERPHLFANGSADPPELLIPATANQVAATVS